jgi:hypothetical protein
MTGIECRGSGQRWVPGLAGGVCPWCGLTWLALNAKRPGRMNNRPTGRTPLHNLRRDQS